MKTSSEPFQISPVARDLPPSGIRRFFDIVVSMDNVISLGVGEPDFVTPWHIREASVFALEKGYTSYTSNRGLVELRDAIAQWTHERYNVLYDPGEEILITVGVSEAMDLAMRALLAPGDEVLVPEPCYVSYVPTVLLAGGTVNRLPLWNADGFKLTPELLEQYISSSTRVLAFNYPCNPTGVSYSREELSALADVIIRHNIFVISDEIYDLLTYDRAHVSLSSLPGMKERTLYLNGFSKAYAMTGYRLGYACGPAPLIDAMHRIHQYTILCAPIVSQMAGIEALHNGEDAADKMRLEYNHRRHFLVTRLKDAGFSCHMPEGAFYVFPSIEHTGMSSEDFALKLLEKERVAVVPGTAFGHGGENFIRMSYASSFDQLKDAMTRISHFVTHST